MSLQVIEKGPIVLPQHIQEAIEDYWEDRIKEKPDLYNGTLWHMDHVESGPKGTVITVKKTDYAHWQYSKHKRPLPPYRCVPLSVVALIETQSSFVVGQQGFTTESPGRIQFIGGVAEEEDLNVSNRAINHRECIKRELREEAGLEEDAFKSLEPYHLTFESVHEANPHIGIIYRAVTDMEEYNVDSAHEMYSDKELSTLLYIPKTMEGIAGFLATPIYEGQFASYFSRALRRFAPELNDFPDELQKLFIYNGAIFVDQEDDYILLMLNMADGRQCPYLKMLNPSIKKWHLEGVHPDRKTVREALAWRNRLEIYEPPQAMS